ncbi:MAG: hydroxylamine reductase, partial [Deltaproteobacteria bacterium]|nr:hydroxylamine reductase [Deltaproteobacteria bacterium]
LNNLLSLVMKTGEYGVRVMQMLDSANTERFGHPVPTDVYTGTKKGPAILVSGHDLLDLYELLRQTEGKGINVYTHGEMLPAHSYPELKKFSHLVGNFGTAWHNQRNEFKDFGGAILFTTNCLVKPDSIYKDNMFTTGTAGFPECVHIPDRKPGVEKDFSHLIEKALQLPGPGEKKGIYLKIGFGHNTILSVADKIVSAVKDGKIKKFVVMAGCDGRNKNREYYTEFAKNLPSDTVILTAGCAKYRYNMLALGDIEGIPRIVDAGQCNDSYTLAVTALRLKEMFGLDDINKLPIVYNIAWYEQKAVIVLLALLYLGVKNIRLGPTLPSFINKNVRNTLVERFGIKGIESVERDIKDMMA